MLTIQIQDEQLAQQLRQIAERENRPVEDVLRSMVEHYPTRASEKPVAPAMRDAVRRVRRKAYAKARRYWQPVGDTARAALTDEELDAVFGAFDEVGIPRLKSELSPEPPVGSLAHSAKIAAEANIRTGNPVDAARADDILSEEFADYLLSRMRGELPPATL